MASIIGAVAIVSGALNRGADLVIERTDPYRVERAGLQALRLGVTPQQVQRLLGAPVVSKPLTVPGGPTQLTESIYGNAGTFWVQTIFDSGELVLFNMQVCSRDIRPSFVVNHGVRIVLNESRLADIAKVSFPVNYSAPVSSPASLLEGPGADIQARASEADGLQLEYWGGSGVCGIPRDVPGDCWSQPVSPFFSRNICNLHGDFRTVRFSRAPGMDRLRSQTIIDTYGLRADGTQGLPILLRWEQVDQFS